MQNFVKKLFSKRFLKFYLNKILNVIQWISEKLLKRFQICKKSLQKYNVYSYLPMILGTLP